MSVNISDQIINVLKNGPMQIDEIAFRVRSTKTIVSEMLSRLEKVKIVKQTNVDYYELNKQNEFDLLRMFS